MICSPQIPLVIAAFCALLTTFAGAVLAAADNRQTLRRLPATVVRTADRRSVVSRREQPTINGIRVRQHITAGRRHAARRANDAARNSYMAALRELAAARVQARVAPSATRSLTVSLVALREARDFHAPGSVVPLDPYAMAVTHQSPVLKGDREPGLSSYAAIARYAAFASGQLAAACGNEPLASEALFGLGQLHAARARADGVFDSLASQYAKVFFSAALRVNPRDSRAGNELGVVLAQTGAWDRALVVFRQSAAHAPHAAIWHNLGVVHQFRGERDMAVLAQAEAARVEQVVAPRVVPDHLSWLDANRPGQVILQVQP